MPGIRGTPRGHGLDECESAWVVRALSRTHGTRLPLTRLSLPLPDVGDLDFSNTTTINVHFPNPDDLMNFHGQPPNPAPALASVLASPPRPPAMA